MESIKKYVIKDSHGNIKAQGGLSVVGEVNVAVDGDVGTPTADAVYEDGVLTITLHDIKGERGNGITDIEVDEREGDEAVNTVTFKTTDNPEGTSFHINNGSRGTGIAEINEELSNEDGGVNYINIRLTDGTTFVFTVTNGTKGEQGATVHYDAATDVVLDTKPGDSTVMGMTQKAITDEISLVRDACADYEEISSGDLNEQDCCLGSSSWAKTNDGTQSHVAIPVEYGWKVRITPASSHTSAFIGFLKTYNPPYTNGSTVVYSPGQARTTIPTNAISSFAVPNGAHWLILTTTDYSLHEVSYRVEVVHESAVQGIAAAKEMAGEADRKAELMASATTLLNTNVAEVAGYINTSTNNWGASTVNFSKLVDVRKYRGRKIRVEKNPNGLCQFAFVNNTTTTGAASYSWDNRVIDVSAETGAVELYVPYGANYMYMRSTTTNSTDITPTIYVWSDIMTESAESTSFLTKGEIDLSGATVVQNSLGSEDWYYNATNHSSHIVVPVKPYELYILTNTVYGNFAFLTDDYLTPASGAIPFVNGTYREHVSANTTRAIIIPDGCAYLCLNYVDGGGTTMDWTLERGVLVRNLPQPEPETQAVAPPIRLRVCSWNVGHFALGAGTSSVITHEQYETMRQKWAVAVNDISADIMLCHEYSANFVEAESGQSAILAKNTVFKPYKYNYIGTQVAYECEAHFANLPLLDVHTVTYDVQSRSYRVGTLMVGDDVIKVVATHLDWDGTENRAAQIQQLIDDFADDDKVIIGADFNVANTAEYDAFTSAGYQMANHGYLGNIKTYPAGNNPTSVLDNIVCKGFSINGINIVNDDTLSDHCAIYADFTLIR